MTRKDYVLIAAAISSAFPGPNYPKDSGYKYAQRLIAQKIGDAIAQNNPKFDRELFLKAAGVQA